MSLSRTLDKIGCLKFRIRVVATTIPKLSTIALPFQIWHIVKLNFVYRSAGAKSLNAIVNDKTELIVDGFQGSGNSFLAHKIGDAQTTPIRFAHHLHSPNKIAKGVRLGVPTIVTIREPKASVVSLIRRWGYIDIKTGLWAWYRFYSALLPIREDIVVSPFKITTESPKEAVALINRKFQTNFAKPQITPKRSFSQSETVKAEKRTLLEQISSSEFATLVKNCESIYEEIVSSSLPYQNSTGPTISKKQ